VERNEALKHEHDASQGEKAAAMVRCVYCGEDMVRDALPRFNRGFGICVLIIGLLLSMLMLLLLGLPMVVIGAYMAVASRAVWTCRACRAVVERHET
jgi:hypothetical protein